MATTDAPIAQKTEGFSGESGCESPAMPVTVIRPCPPYGFVRMSPPAIAPARDDESEHLPSAALEKKGVRMHGTIVRASETRTASLLHKVLAVLLSFVLAASLTPTYAWAAAASPADAGVVETAPLPEDSSGNSDVQPAEPEIPADGALEPVAPSQPEPPVQPEPPARPEQAPASPETSVPSESAPAPDAADAPAAVALQSDYYVMIQDGKDIDDSYSYTKGDLSSGVSMWANVYAYDEWEYWDYGVSAESGWAYQWMASDVQSDKPSDYAPIAGQTDQCLTLTDELAKELAGKYIAVTVSEGGTTLWGPASFSGGSLSKIRVPGPVLAPGTTNLEWAHVVKADAEFENAGRQQDVKAAAAGDVLKAAGWKPGAATAPLQTADGVTLSWQISDSRSGAFSEVATGDVYTVPENAVGKFLKVVADGGGKTAETSIVPIVAAGAYELHSLEIEKPARLETGAVLTAHAFKKNASGWGKGEEATEGVTFAWKWTDADPSKYGSKPEWHVIEGQTGSTFTVPDDFAGRWVVATATAGINEVPSASAVNYAAVGPFKKAGTYTVYSVALTRDGSSYDGRFKAGQTLGAIAKEKDQTGSLTEIPSSALSYTWQIADSSNGAYEDLTDGNVHKASFVIPESYVGKYLKCIVTSGDSSKSREMKGSIAPADAVAVKTVELSYDGQDGSALPAGTTVTAKAIADDGSDVTASDKLAWSWYTADTSYPSAAKTKIDGATGSTFTVPADDASYVGKYIFAAADGGMGIRYSSATKAVSMPGAVELHSVEVQGTAKVGLVLDAVAKKTVTAPGSTSSYTAPVDPSDTVSYQWQYATRKTTADSSFTDIAGATGKTFAVPETYPDGVSSLGTYVRVKAVSTNAVVSTKKPYYGSTQPVDPAGPVTQAGVYTLSSVTLSATSPDGGEGQGFQTGNTIVPQAQVKNGAYSEKPAPSDAKLTYAWYAADSRDAKGVPIEGYDPADGRLVLTEGLKGKYLSVTVSSGDNTVSSTDGSRAPYLVVGADEYELLRVTTTPQANSSTTQLATGDAVRAAVQARTLTSVSTGKDVTANVSVTWYVSDTKDGSYTELPDASGAEIAVPAAAKGKYLKAVATSGASSVETVFEKPVIDGASLAALVKKLEDKYYVPELLYSENGGNINEVLSAKIEELGFSGVSVRVKAVEFSQTDPQAEVGISSADDATNGAVTYFCIDPNAYAGYNIDSLRSAKVTFELAQQGETVDYRPNKAVMVPWNQAKLAELLQKAAEEVAIGYAQGDTADSVTGDLTLPHRAGAKSKYLLTWESDSERIAVQRPGFSDYTGKVSRSASDETVNLTVHAALNAGGPEGLSASKTFTVVVKGDPQKVEEDRKELAQKLDDAFKPESLEYSENGASAVDPSKVTGDLRLPTARQIGVDGKYYPVTYTADSDAIVVNGYRANVYRGLPGTEPVKVKLTAAVESASNAAVSAAKTIEVTVLPLKAAEIDAEVALMDAAVAGYAPAILNGQPADAVTGDLHSFQKAYRASDGSVAWSYDVHDNAPDGIVPDDLPNASEQAGYRTFKSSVPSVVKHENLHVSQPEYNTKVTVSSRLKSEAFARYAERYASDPAWGSKFAQLADRDVSTSFTVLGTSGVDNPKVTATLSVVGEDAQGNPQTWAAADTYTLDTGATAADLSMAAFKATGLKADYGTSEYGWFLNSIASPFDGRVLGWDQSTGKFWQLFVNGVSSDLGASGVVLQPGDSVVWSYSTDGSQPPVEEVSVSAAVYGKNAAGDRETWAPSTSFTMKRGATAAELSDALFAQAGLKTDTGMGSYGWFLNSIASPFDGRVLGWNEATGDYWQLFVNGVYSQLGAGSVVLQPGDTVTWVYGSDESMTPEGKVSATIDVMGEDANGVAQRWAAPASFELDEGATAADLSEALFAQAGLKADYGTGAYGWYLSTITSPFDGRVLGWDEATGKYWCLYVNGVQSEMGAGGVVLAEGDTVSWCYTTYGAELPDADDIVIDPSAPRPDYKGEHAMFGGSTQGGNVTQAPTPTAGTQLNWEYEFGEGLKSGSDPLIVNGDLYVVAGTALRVLDAKTGVEKARTSIGARAGYFCRPAYAGGIVIVPREDGSLAAFTADTLTCVWISDALGALEARAGNQYQALSTLTVNGDYVYAGFTMAGSLGASMDLSVAGALVCVDTKDGRVVWTKMSDAAQTGEAAGYYWAGAAASGDDIVIGDESGTVSLIDGSTGDVLSSVSGLGGAVRAGVISVPGDADTLLAVSRDNGTLHKIAREGDRLALKASVPFAKESTSTPAVAGGKAFVCGVDAQGYGTVSAIDLASMTVVATARGGNGKAQAAPLVSMTGGKTYVYFTCNGRPGGVYAYCLEDDAVTQIYVPEEGRQQYSTSTVVADAQGNLYYANDSGVLFSLAGAESWKVTFDSCGGSAVNAAFVAKGRALARPADPTRDGFVFDGWYADAAYEQAWDFATAPSADMTLYAKWTPVEQGGQNAPSAGGALNASTGASSSAGIAQTVLAGKTVLSAAGAPVQAASAAAAVEADEAVAEAFVSSQGAAAKASSAASDAAQPEQGGSMPWWPFVGLAVGVCGLAVAIAWAMKTRKNDGR